MSGYYGYSMSNNAIEAYENGEKPYSKWTKASVISAIKEAVENGEVHLPYSVSVFNSVPLGAFKSRVLEMTSWHHTSAKYNKTEFYSLRLDWLESVSAEDIYKMATEYKERKRAEKEAEKEVKVLYEYLYWTKWSRRPRKITGEGVVKGNWCYLQDGTKKNIHGNYFWIIKYLEG